MSRDAWKVTIAALAGSVLVRLLGWSWRVRWVNDDILHESHRTRGPVIYVLWHGELLPLLFTHRHRNVSVMISEHRDGELIARIAESLGFRTVRGSTTRGAARALLGACRSVEAGHDLAITVDGPRGPARVVAPGSMIVSQRTGAPMIPVTATARRAWRLRSWDRFLIPKPFTRLTVAYGPTFVAEAASARDAADEADRIRIALERVEGAVVNGPAAK